MNLNYDRLKAKQEHGGNHWTSYSDLFLVLSVVFLLLYVVSNIRSGGVTISAQTQITAAKQEVAEYKERLQVYEGAKDYYLQTGASDNEKKIYNEVMNKLSLLQADATEKRAAAEKDVAEAKAKEEELNRYQALVKNIVSENMIAHNEVKTRDSLLAQKDQAIVQRDQHMNELSKTIALRESEINDNNAKIEEIQEKLKKKIHDLNWADRQTKRSKLQHEEEVAQLKAESEESIKHLQAKNLKDLAEKQATYEASIAQMQSEHERVMAEEQKDFDQKLSVLNITADEKIAKAHQHERELEGRNQEYQTKLVGLNTELNSTRKSIQTLEGKYKGKVESLQAKLGERKLVAKMIQGAMAKIGSAEIDGETGDVMLRFNDEYFDKNSAKLKPNMIKTLEEFFPAYAKTLFEDPKIGNKIASIEIVGFSSPTYKGRYVDPDSLRKEDRKAVDYNMDLSYRRAKAIFTHAFDSQKMRFKFQE